MRFCRVLLTAAIALFAFAGHVVAIVGPLIMAPLVYFIRDAPAAFHVFVALLKPVAYRVIGSLKPEYRESLLTSGHSLQAA